LRFKTAPPSTPMAAPPIAVATGNTTDFKPEPPRATLPLGLEGLDVVPFEVLGTELDPAPAERERPLARDRAFLREAAAEEPRPPVDAFPDRVPERVLALGVARLVGLLADVRRFFAAALFWVELLSVAVASARSCADRWLVLAIIPPCTVAMYGYPRRRSLHQPARDLLPATTSAREFQRSAAD
jgi:hypothetical protein